MQNMIMEWVGSHQLVFWLLASLLFLLFEVGSPGLFFFLSFFFGALCAAGASLLVPSWIFQVSIFLIGSMGSFFLLTRWVKQRSSVDDDEMQTNVYAMRSKRGIVVKAITGDTMGLVKVGGETWSARSKNGQSIEAGKTVVIIRIKGVHLLVEEQK